MTHMYCREEPVFTVYSYVQLTLTAGFGPVDPKKHNNMHPCMQKKPKNEDSSFIVACPIHDIQKMWLISLD